MKRFLSMLLAVTMIATMFAGFTAWADEAVVKNFIDSDMDNVTANIPTGYTLTDDATLNSKVAKYELPVGTSTRTSRYQPADEGFIKGTTLGSAGVLWGEISIKYEGNFTRIGWEHSQASPPLWINDDGSVMTGGYNIHTRSTSEPGSDTGYDLELGKWYHIVSALDYTSNTNGTITIWVNGKKIVNAAAAYSRLQGSKGLNYVDFRYVQALDTASTVYIDNYRAYTTAAIDSHPESPALVDANSADGIGVTAEHITGASEATVAQVKAAFTNGASLVFVKDGNVLGADENVFGATAYVFFANGKGFRTYDVAGTHIEDFIDLDFNDWTTVKPNDTDKNGNAFSWAYVNFSAPSVSVVTDAEKGNNVLKFDSTNPNGYAQFKHDLTGHDYFTRNESQWMEWSVKFEGGFTKVAYDHNNGLAPIYINANGELKRFAQAAVMYQFELDKWYHIVALMDTVNAPTNDGGRLYVWVNGEKIFNGADYNSSFKVQADGGLANWKYYRFYVNTPQEGTNVYIDDVKAYSTGSGKDDTHAADDWNFDIADANEDDDIYLEDGKIIAGTKTVADVKSAFTGATFTCNKADSEPAADATFTAWAANGYAYKTYNAYARGGATEILKSNAANAMTSIVTASTSHHPVDRMFDGSLTGDNYFKANYSGTETPLVITIPLDAYYELQSLNVYERNLGNQRYVTVELGRKGDFTTVADNFALVSGGVVSKTEIAFTNQIADTVRLTFTGAPVEGQMTYQIWELEAFGYWYADKSRDIIGPIGESAVKSITASIPTANAAHPVTGMINNGMSYSNDGDVYKSQNKNTDDLVVTIKLDAYYTLETVTVYEKWFKGSELNVTVDLGKNGRYTNIATEVPLTVGTSYVTGTPTVIPANETEADTIRLTFSGTSTTGQEQKYQIYEIEATGTKAGDIPVYGKISVGGEGNPLTSFTVSIPTRSSSHPVAGMIDGNREYSSSVGGTDASLYKSNPDLDENPLKVLFTFDGVYNISSVKVFERRPGQNPVTVSVYAGLNGELEELVSDVALTTGAYTNPAKETTIDIPWTDADTVMLVFENEGDYTGAESSYQFSEIEVYGEKAGEVETTGILEAYAFAELTDKAFIVAISNATDVAISGHMFVAAYEGQELVAISPVREIAFGKGVTAQYTMGVEGFIKDGRTYKVFVWDSRDAENPKPLLVSKVITK